MEVITNKSHHDIHRSKFTLLITQQWIRAVCS